MSGTLKECNNSNLSGKDIVPIQQPIPWAVGQFVLLKAVVSGPALQQNQITYLWTLSGNNNYAYKWNVTLKKAKQIDLSPDNGGNPKTGTPQQEVQFFWLPTGAASDVDTVKVVVSSPGFETWTIGSHFKVESPTAVFTGTPSGLGFVVALGASGADSLDVACGNLAEQKPGMTFNGTVGTVNTDTNQAGKLEVVQLLKKTESWTDYGIPPTPTTMSTDGYVLDDVENNMLAANSPGAYSISTNVVNNQANQSIVITDTPGAVARDLMKDRSSVTINWNFSTSLMYQPTGGEWVPLSVIGWNISVTTSVGNGGTQIDAQQPNPILKDPINGKLPDPEKEPEWNIDMFTFRKTHPSFL